MQISVRDIIPSNCSETPLLLWVVSNGDFSITSRFDAAPASPSSYQAEPDRLSSEALQTWYSNPRTWLAMLFKLHTYVEYNVKITEKVWHPPLVAHVVVAIWSCMVSFNGLSHYNLRRRGEFWISPPFKRYSLLNANFWTSKGVLAANFWGRIPQEREWN